MLVLFLAFFFFFPMHSISWEGSELWCLAMAMAMVEVGA
jgi:hypothetical protein